jgi:Na+/proline symporter
MPATEMIVMIALFAAVALGVIQLLRLVATAITHRTIRRAIDREPSTAEPLLERLTAPQKAPADDDRLAIILIALGLAMIGGSLIADDTGAWMRYAIGGALFPLLIGAALWLRHYAIERSRRRAGAE